MSGRLPRSVLKPSRIDAYVEQIRKPIMVVARKTDPRVPVSESDPVVAALKAPGTPARYMLAKDEGHGFRKTVLVLRRNRVPAEVLTRVRGSRYWIGASPSGQASETKEGFPSQTRRNTGTVMV